MNPHNPSYPDTVNASRGTFDPFWPLALLAASLICLFIYQITMLSEQRETIRTTQDQMETAYRNSGPQQEQLLAQSRAVQAKLESLVNDLLSLAKAGDADAKAIVDKYKISQQAPAAGAAASPAASPAAAQ